MSATDKQARTGVGEKSAASNGNPAGAPPRGGLRGLTFRRVYSDASISPFDALEWELRTAAIAKPPVTSATLLPNDDALAPHLVAWYKADALPLAHVKGRHAPVQAYRIAALVPSA